ncbi:MAG TPA: DUF1501 domain-containing protein [Candidatus Dormibacteraeota bacterium]|nr:DUF1501 domain-containing protein [Candidatus Dormibacteraeota bacterium]
MSVTRRDFLASGLAGVAGGVIVPPILAKGVFAAGINGIHNNRVLVVVQLAGGNDGLNTVVPYADAAYASARPSVGVRPENVLHIDGSIGLNPALKGVKTLYDAGRVAIVQGVGYDKPTYSHFENLYVWEYADPKRAQTDGWLGKLLGTQIDSRGHPLAGCALGEVSTPAELRAARATVSVIQSVQEYTVRGGPGHQATARSLYRDTPGIYGALFDQALSTAEAGMTTLASGAATYKPTAPYAAAGTSPAAGSLASALQLTAQMIVTEPSVKVCHVVISGFDTHQAEPTRQTALLTEVDTAVSAFMEDISAHGQADRVVLMTWSEFGRRVSENGSQGTDHGAAAPLFIVGKPVKGGLYGEQPSLTNTIDSGNLKYTVDFRSVYQVLIRDWLQGDASTVLGATYPELPVINSA